MCPENHVLQWHSKCFQGNIQELSKGFEVFGVFDFFQKNHVHLSADGVVVYRFEYFSLRLLFAFNLAQNRTENLAFNKQAPVINIILCMKKQWQNVQEYFII